MEHVHAALPRLQIDAKRIAATSGVIALHVGVLMMLMMPPPMAAPQADETVVVLPDWQPRRLPPPPPPPPKPVDKPKPQPVDAQPVQKPVVEEFVESVDQTPGPMDVIAPPDVPEIPTTFDTGPATSVFVQLVPDVSPAPPYPRPAMERRVEGKVVLRIHVDASGRPIEVSVENSSGSKLLDEAAMKFVKARWHFVPAQQDGRATEAWALLPIDYVLQ
jgi:protein TonB